MITHVGEKVSYHYKVTNTGDVTLNPMHVTDPMPGLSKISCPATKLAPGASTTCTATRTTTSADLGKRTVDNTGTATGTAPDGHKVQASPRSRSRWSDRRRSG